MPAPLYLRSALHERHDVPGHPERPERIHVLEAELARHDWLGWERAEASAATREQLERVHPGRHLDFLEDLSARGGGPIDMDTTAVAGTWEASLRAAGAAVNVVDALLDGAAPAAFAGVRPCGHHAEAARAMGFCFLNNVAVGAAHALAAHGLERVLVLDWDVHHGNGTNDIFHASDQVLFLSIHQSPLYPGTGPASDTGSGEGEGYTVNVPVPPGTGDDGFGSIVEHVATPLVLDWEPQLVLVSAGFDAHVADPLASCRVTHAGFAGMTGSLRRACAAIEAPLGLVLEGGYGVEGLARSVAALLPVLGAEAPPAPDDTPAVHPLAAAAAGRLEARWPAVAQAQASAR